MSILKKEGDVYIELPIGRKYIKLKQTSLDSNGDGTPIPNGTVVNIVQPSIDNNHVLVSVNGQSGYINIHHLKVARNVFNGKPIIGMEYRPPVAIEADTPLLAPPQRQPQQQQQQQQQQQYAPPPSHVQSSQQSGAPPAYNHVMANLPTYPVVYQDPTTGRFYAVGPDGNSYWLNGGSRRRKQRSYKKRLQTSRSRSRSRSRSNKRSRK
jgi:hypothetical protein